MVGEYYRHVEPPCFARDICCVVVFDIARQADEMEDPFVLAYFPAFVFCVKRNSRTCLGLVSLSVLAPVVDYVSVGVACDYALFCGVGVASYLDA